MKRALLWAPLAVFILFLIIFMTGLLSPEGQIIRSHMIGKPLPNFALPAGLPNKPGLQTRDFQQGKPKLLNIFASWCVPCAAEAPQLMQLARSGVTIDAVAIRDRPEDIANFLARYGNPYRKIGSDRTSSVQLALGSSGVPETFVIDGNGVIRYQHIGDIRPENVSDIIGELAKAQ